MSKVCRFYETTVGKKVVVAVTGLMMIGFVVGHMAGNLKAFAGVAPDGVHKLDHYAEFLREFASPILGEAGFLWLARLGLLAAVILHIVTVIQLKIRNAAANPAKYQGSNYRASSLAARTMTIGGLFLAIFIVIHILHFTTGHLHSSFRHGAVYANIYAAFQSPYVTGFYLLAMVFLGLHLVHGGWSLFQTLGLDNPDVNPMLRRGVQLLSLVVVLGFVSVPLSIFLGVLSAP